MVGIRWPKPRREKEGSGPEPADDIRSKMPRGTVYCLVLVLVLLNIVYRYPLQMTHEAGADTTFIHTLASSVANEGSARWVLNPASLFGLYALSYPSGVPFLLAEFSDLSGLSIEGSILVFGMVMGIIGSLGAFLVSRDLFRRNSYAFLAAFLFSLAPFFLKDTTWVGSSRGAVVALIPILLWLLMRATRFERSKYFMFSIVIFLLAISLHRMGFLIVFFFISFFFISSIHKITQKIRFALVRYELLFRTIASVTALSGFFLIFYVQILFPGYGGFNIVDVYGRGTFFEGSDFLTMVLNMAVNFVGKVGILIPLSIVGLGLYVWKRPKMIDEKFVLVITLLLIPFLSLRDYISEFLILFFVFTGIFVFAHSQSRWKSRRKMITVGVILFLVVSLAF
ncbi:MAG: glycosyltransferase family 39 protein, partial [Candidatus Bathyarchaeota archaeon]|nr:glycosyltransferase family 39 protein [Candidatus Bathyarchaeota archaeon]